jgi:hypothetical protein
VSHAASLFLTNKSKNIDSYPSEAVIIIYEFSKAIWTKIKMPAQRHGTDGCEKKVNSSVSRTGKNKRQKVSVDSCVFQNPCGDDLKGSSSASMESLVRSSSRNIIRFLSGLMGLW